MFVLYRLKIGVRGADKVRILASGEQRKGPPTAGVIEEFVFELKGDRTGRPNFLIFWLKPFG